MSTSQPSSSPRKAKKTPAATQEKKQAGRPAAKKATAATKAGKKPTVKSAPMPNRDRGAAGKGGGGVKPRSKVARARNNRPEHPSFTVLPPVSPPAERGHGAWIPAFLEALIEHAGHIGRSCAAADVNRSTVAKWRDNNPEFAEAFRQSVKIGHETLKDEAIRRAVHGMRRYKFTKGGEPLLHPVTGEPYYEHEYSDTLTALLLKGAFPDEFADRSKIQHEAHVTTQVYASREERKQALEAARLAATEPI